MEYEKTSPHILDFYHTGVPVTHRGQGIANHLVKVRSYCSQRFQEKLCLYRDICFFGIGLYCQPVSYLCSFCDKHSLYVKHILLSESSFDLSAKCSP